jgi:hypothetical protein
MVHDDARLRALGLSRQGSTESFCLLVFLGYSVGLLDGALLGVRVLTGGFELELGLGALQRSVSWPISWSN